MKSLWFLHAALVGLLLAMLPVRADNCAANVVVHRNVVVTPVVVTHEVVAVTPLIAQFVPLAVYPAYGAGYIAPPQAPVAQTAQTAQPAANQDVVQLLKSIESRLQRLEGQQTPQVNPMPKVEARNTVDGSVYVQKCASCHDAAVSATKGGRVSLTQDGSVLAWDDALTLRVLRSLSDGSMPRGGALNETEANSAVSFALNHKK